MTKQKLMAVLGNRWFHMGWSVTFFIWSLVLAQLATSPVAIACGWLLAGFMLCHLIDVVMWERAARQFRAGCRTEFEQMRDGMRRMVEEVKAELDQAARERGFEMETEVGFGEPPPRWRQ